MAKKNKEDRSRLDNFAELYPRQNWRIRQEKDAKGSGEEGKISPWNDADLLQQLNVFRKSDAENGLEEALQDISARGVICNAIAKCMVLDKKTFESACKSFWFSATTYVKYRPSIEVQIKREVEAVKQRELAKTNIIELSKHHQFDNPFKLKRSDDGVGETLLSVQYKEKEITQKIPENIIEVADLLTKEPFKAKPQRSSFSARFKPETAEMIKLGAAACNKSATAFLEVLVANYTQCLVRGHVTKFGEDQPMLQRVAQLIYDILEDRYKECGDFPTKKRKDNSDPMQDDGAKWYPYSDSEESKTSKITVETRQHAVAFLSSLMDIKSENLLYESSVMHELQTLLTKLTMAKDDNHEWSPIFEVVMNKFQDMTNVQRRANDSKTSMKITQQVTKKT